jgi:hypothetical protein
MSAPPHSVNARPSCVEGDRYADRNDFLNLLLGLITVAEQILAFVPELAPDPAPEGRGERGAPVDHLDIGPLLR